MCCTRQDFVTLSLDGLHVLCDNFHNDHLATKPYAIDLYRARPELLISKASPCSNLSGSTECQRISLLHPLYNQVCCVDFVTILPPNSDGSKYDQYCRQKLMLHKSFQRVQQLRKDTRAAWLLIHTSCVLATYQQRLK